MAEVRIERADAGRIGELEPITRSFHRHHLTVDPAIPGIPPRHEDDWWAIRSERYRGWLGAGDGAFLLIAELEGSPVGYAFATLHDQDDSHATGERFAQLESLAVLERTRGAGIGTALLRQVYRELHAAGVGEMVISALVTNDPAIRLYEREGFRPWVVLLIGRIPDPDRGS